MVEEMIFGTLASVSEKNQQGTERSIRSSNGLLNRHKKRQYFLRSKEMARQITEVGDFLGFDFSSTYASYKKGSSSNDQGSFGLERSSIGAFFDLFAHPLVPILSVFVYLMFSKQIVKGVKGSSTTPCSKSFIMAHNLVLAIYSGWTCYYTWSSVFSYIEDFRMKNGYENTSMVDGMWNVMCPGDKRDELWFGKFNMMFWITHFYISKYYEFVDTWILLWDDKNPIFLQTFHHAGIAILMWMLTVTLSSPVIVVVCFNSFIHTIMYVYYVLSTFDKVKFATLRKSLEPFKPLVTNMQIIQFFVGLSITVQTHFIEGCLNKAQHFTLFFMESYAFCLILLFFQFYRKNYLSKKDKSKTK